MDSMDGPSAPHSAARTESRSPAVEGRRAYHGSANLWSSRRDLLRFGGTGLAAWLTATGCNALSTDPANESGSESGSNDDDVEAPELARQVEAGDLPPVEQRLPNTPLEVKPADRPGVYGGTWRTAVLGPTDEAWLRRVVGDDNLLNYDHDLGERFPNVAEEVSANDDGTKFVIHLREGLKWSDGEPFTADDIVFAQNDVANNTELNPVPANNPATAEKVDEYTVRITMEQPEGLFLHGLANDNPLVNKPFHYLKEFHRDHNPDIDALVTEHDRADWVELFQSMGSTIEGTADNAEWNNTELPTLRAWILTEPMADGGQVRFKRNPYYFKVDSDGRQLPYIDEVVFDVVQDEEVMLLKATNGEIDMHFRHINTLTNKPALAQSREDGDYEFFDTTSGLMNTALIAFNLTHEDPVRREIYNNRDFRIGLSYAINREEIIQTAYAGQGEPWQAAPRRESPLYDEEMAKQYTEYSTERADQHLDRAGYAERDDEGFRLGPDGNTIAVTIEYAVAFKPEWSDALELVKQYWDDVGIKTRVQPQDRSLFLTRNEANKSDIIVWHGDGGIDPISVPDWYFPDPAYLVFANLWAAWYDGEESEGEEPPEIIRTQMDYYDQLKGTTDPDEQQRLMTEILQIAKEQFWVIGTNLSPPSYGIAKHSFHNVPKTIIDPAQTGSPITACQCFIEG